MRLCELSGTGANVSTYQLPKSKIKPHNTVFAPIFRYLLQGLCVSVAKFVKEVTSFDTPLSQLQYNSRSRDRSQESVLKMCICALMHYLL